MKKVVSLKKRTFLDMKKFLSLIALAALCVAAPELPGMTDGLSLRMGKAKC